MTVTIGIDSGSHFCGVAIYEDGVYKSSQCLEFEGPYTHEKLKDISSAFSYLFFKHNPDIVVIEEPLAVRNGKITRILNLIGGVIFGQACRFCDTVDFIHNKTLKKLMGIKTKEDSVTKARSICHKEDLFSDEADAILLVESYIRLITGGQNGGC